MIPFFDPLLLNDACTDRLACPDERMTAGFSTRGSGRSRSSFEQN